jgi:hypothetical protein
MPLLGDRAPEPAWEQRLHPTEQVGLGDSATIKSLVLMTINLLLILAVFYCPGLIFVLMIMQPMFCILLIKFTVFSASEEDELIVPGIFLETNLGLQAFEDLPRRMLALAELVVPRWGWWARVSWCKFGVTFALFLASLALLYMCVVDPGLMMVYCVGQPLLIILGGKWLLDYDAVAPQVIKLERVVLDTSAVDLPRSCAVCLGNFDDPASLLDSSPAPTAAEQNIVIVEGADAGEWRPDDIVRLKCDPAHCFHAGCIQAWLVTHGTCPLCRSRSGKEISWWRRLYLSSTTLRSS